MEFSAFAEALARNGPGFPQHFGFAGAAYDADTQLYHHDARWRDSNESLPRRGPRSRPAISPLAPARALGILRMFLV